VDTPALVRLELASLRQVPSHLQTMLRCQTPGRREGVWKTSRRRTEEEGIAGTIPIVVGAEMKIEPSVWASGKAESSAPGEETDAMPGNERIPGPRA